MGSLAVILPILWGILTSLKIETNIAIYPPQLLPHPVTLEHYVDIMVSRGAPRFILNSLILAVGTMFLTLVIAAPGAYAAARYRFRGKQAILLTILATSMIPGISILIPIYFAAVRAKVLNNYAFMIVVYTAWLVPQAIWLTKGFIETIPKGLDEAAMLDGCGTLGVFCRIILPLIQPGLAAISILVFVFVWNDFLIGVALTSQEEMRTVQVGLVRFLQDTMGVWWGQFMAFTVVAIAPVLLVFIFGQRRFIEGLSSGGIKG
jgi:ABC-type glycerol-3-phosphate transport system permease component